MRSPVVHHLDQGTVSRIEHAQIDQPRVDSLIALGLVLSIPASDLFILAHWLRADDLPDLAPYMHAKYPKLPESAYQEIGEFFTGLWRRYRVNVSTPEET
ncbi:MAG: hypothetical protein WDN27_05375 [Candidatus Saccharibacteria bacterium]